MTSNICSALLCLARNPALVDELRANDDGRLLDAVIKESMRLLPSTGGGMRLLSQSIVLKGYTIPAGWVVSVDPRISQCLADSWATPEAFDPKAHFLSRATPLPPHAFMPGGVGAHVCPGIPTAHSLIREYLGVFLRRFSAFSFDEPVTWRHIPFSIVTDATLLTVQATKGDKKED